LGDKQLRKQEISETRYALFLPSPSGFLCGNPKVLRRRIDPVHAYGRFLPTDCRVLKVPA
jgi:hypothetical protein